MKIAVLNGSPKGEISVTVQYVRFIQKKYPQHEFKLLNVAHDILKLEKSSANFQQVIDEVNGSDGVIWAFPLYVFLVASQYKRFIELIWENGAEDAFKGKYTGVLSTSIHFFDHTAHNYMRGICDDLEMKSIEYFSADMDDIFIDEKRNILLKWAGDLFAAMENKTPAARASAPLVKSKFSYRPGKGLGKVDPRGLKIRVLADIDDEKSNIAGMVRRYAGAFSGDIEVLKLQDVDIKGGCLGCMQCAFDNICVYQDKDSYVEVFNRTMRDSDVTIFAGTVRDRFFSARVKMFWDRGFFNGHVPTHIGQQVGFIVSGPLAQLPNMQQVLQANAEMSEANYTGVVTDECGNSALLDTLIDGFASRCADYARSKFIRPKTFLGVGGHKIFRDSIWSRLRFPFNADYRFYQAHDMFDFPQNDTRYLEFGEKMTQMIQDPKMREMVRKMMKTEIVKGYKQVVETK